jgi:DNA-binding MarR family transcriptional regulator
MSIIRVERMSQPYTMIANATLQDTSISLEARGLLTYLLSKPDTWAVVVTWLQTEMNVGREKLNRIIKELENAGYIETRIIRDGGQFAQYERIVHESPTAEVSTDVGKVDSGQVASGQDVTIKERVKKEQIEERTDLIIESSLLLVSRMQEVREANIGDKFPETKAQRTIMAVLVRQHGAETVQEVMEWAMADSFWAAIIITPTMLHKHFGKVKFQSSRSVSTNQSVLEQYLAEHPEEDD